MSDILEGLNKEQKEAVTHGEGPLLIVAGAGTGKTTVITRRIAYLIEQGVAPENILALTFAEKAAEEMEERVDQLLPLGYVNVNISTFHSFGEQILKDYGIEIGLPDFQVLDEVGQWLLVRNNLDKFDLKYYRPLGNPTKFIKALLQHISRAKDEVVSSDEYLEYAESLKLSRDNSESGVDERGRLIEVADAYHTYQQLLLENSKIDFGDLINYPLRLLRERPEVLKKIQSQYPYILVDEFQDTNIAQYELLKLLAGNKQNITVVGDDDQSIFKFRGASVSNILQYQQDFKKSKFLSLIENYRTGQNILDSAYEFIKQNNPDRLEEKLKISKKLKSNIRAKGQIEPIVASDSESEANQVVQKMIELMNSYPELTWDDFAILSRSHSQFEPFINKLEEKNIPFIYVANQGLYKKEIILDLIAYFKLLDNYHESEALSRVLRFPIFNFSTKSLVELSHYANKKSISLYESLKDAALIVSLDEDEVQSCAKALSLISKHSELAKNRNIVEVYSEVFSDLDFKEKLQLDYQNQRYIESFTKKIRDFSNQSDDKTLQVFMDQMEFERGAGSEGDLNSDLDAGPEAVRLMTIHAAKGLEFGNVFVIGLVDKRFPSIRRKEQIELPEKLIKEILPEGDFHLEEERRLFYVAMTRAKHNLYLTRAHDYGGKLTKRPSRFLIELGLAKDEKSVSTGQVELIAKKEKGPSFPIPKSFSFSQISTFLKCPLEYKYRYVLKIPFKGSGSMSFGSTIHRTFEKFLKLSIQSGTQDLFTKIKSENTLPSFSDLKTLYENSWIDDWYDSATEKARVKKEGLRVLKDFYDQIKKDMPQTQYLEQRFKIKLGKHLIKGVIDRIDKDAEEYIIIDYKTGKKDKLSSVDKEQLTLYQMAVTEILKVPVKDLQYWYLRDGLDIKSFLASESDIEKFEQKYSDAIDKIISTVKNDSFLELDKKTPHLKRCEYLDYE